MHTRMGVVVEVAWIALAICGISTSSAAASTLWAYGGGRASSLHQIDVATGAVVSTVALSGGSPVVFSDLAGDRDSQGGLVWAISGFSSDNRLSALNPAAGQFVSSVVVSAAETISSLAIDPVTGEFYGASGTSLYRILPATGATTLVGPTGLRLSNALGFDRLGNLYGIGNEKQLVAVNKATGATTLIATLGVQFMEDIAVRPETGVMYGLGYGPNYSLYEIDLLNGSLSNLGPSLIRPNGLAFAALAEPATGFSTVVAAFMITVCRRAL